MRRIVLFFVCTLSLLCVTLSCDRPRPIDPASLRGVPLETLQQMREDILARHPDGRLSAVETANVELLREQERRLENAWVFGEWRERHGARLIFRDDGSVSVGAREGEYDELGVYKFISPVQPAYESTWSIGYDQGGNPVVRIARRSGGDLIYPFGESRNRVYEQCGDLQTAVETGCYFTKSM